MRKDKKSMDSRAARNLALCMAAAVGMTAAAPFEILAQQSPEFAYSAEKWASLRDDNLEYDEIADLVHEYNNTVVQNAISYRDEYDKDADDVAQDYYDAAEEIYSNMDYPDTDSENYGSGVVSYVNSEIQARNLEEQGDESTDDAQTLKLGYDQTEAGLVKQAQEQMISYYSQLYSLETLRENVETAKADLASEETRLAAGTSTQSQVLTAKQAVSSAEASLQSAESTLAKAKENLLLMLGWSYGSDVTIGELPEPDLDAISAIDLEADIAKGQENNYTLKKTSLQLSNARTETVRETLTQKQANAVRTVSNSISAAYKSLMLAVSDYEQAQQSLSVRQTSLASAERGLAAGTTTKNSYQSVKAAYDSAEVTVRTKKLALLTAYIDYQWAVNGLADAE